MQCIAISAVQCWSVIEGGNTNRTRGICSTQPSYWGAGGAEEQGQHRLQREQRVEHHEQEEEEKRTFMIYTNMIFYGKICTKKNAYAGHLIA